MDDKKLIVIVLIVIIVLLVLFKKVQTSNGKVVEILDGNGNCPACPNCNCGGGIGDLCGSNSDCAGGLSCENGFCTCSKPPGPEVVTAIMNFPNLDIAWSPVADADYYDVYVDDGAGEEHFVTRVIPTGHTFVVSNNVTFNVRVFSGSFNCGSSPIGFTETTALPSQPCTIYSDCDTLVCRSGYCSSCASGADCPPGHVCQGGNCVADTSCLPCAPDEVCISGSCSCPQPQVIAVKMDRNASLGWPNQITFTYYLNVPGLIGNFEIGWASYGACGSPACNFVTGYRPNFAPMANNQFAPPYDTTCRNAYQHGCSDSCGPGTWDMNFSCVVRVQSACSPLSSYTQWKTDGLSLCANSSSQWLIPF